ncbi:hypothetical protein [Butyricicoccus sp.]|uniref:hypothetical protein n=1 Tax=Butyricicoccus sp. TaxID=2049021 RepID=UPI003F1743C1
MKRHTISGDARKLLDTFIEYASRHTNDSIADSMYYDPDEMRRRALELQKQLEKLDAEAEE